MKKYLLICLALIFTFNLFAQEVEKPRKTGSKIELGIQFQPGFTIAELLYIPHELNPVMGASVDLAIPIYENFYFETGHTLYSYKTQQNTSGMPGFQIITNQPDNNQQWFVRNSYLIGVPVKLKCVIGPLYISGGVVFGQLAAYNEKEFDQDVGMIASETGIYNDISIAIGGEGAIGCRLELAPDLMMTLGLKISAFRDPIYETSPIFSHSFSEYNANLGIGITKKL